MLFDIKGIVNQVGANAIGKTLYVVEVDTTLNDRGDESSKTRNEYAINGVVQVLSAEDDEVKEGILRPMDLICFIDEDESNVNYLINYNELKYDNKYYKITQVIHEIGHYEILAKKI
jgi:hypothetical protein